MSYLLLVNVDQYFWYDSCVRYPLNLLKIVDLYTRLVYLALHVHLRNLKVPKIQENIISTCRLR